MGVIFSALLAATAYVLKHYFDRARRHYNSLCNLELSINRLLSALCDNQFQLQLAIQADRPTLLSLRSASLPEEFLRDIASLSLKKNLLSLVMDWERYTSDLVFLASMIEKNLRSTYDEAVRLNHPEHIVRLLITDLQRQLRPKLQQLLEYGNEVEKDAKNCFARIEIHARSDRPFFVRLWSYSHLSEKDVNRLLPSERERLEHHIAEGRAERAPGSVAGQC